MNLYSAKEMTLLLERHGFFFKKNLGQNFLMNENTANRIAKASADTIPAGKKKVAVEIGPGAGSLTRQLSDLFDAVLSIEIDGHLIPVLEESLADCQNVTILHQDALTFDYATLSERFPDCEFAVCSNLPYYITSELIVRMLESGTKLSSITVLIQKEAAARLSSAPGTADFGAITAVVSYYAKCRRLFSVGPGNFIPKPKVDSAVLQMIPYETRPVSPLDEALFFKVIHGAFSARRKTLSNTLSKTFSDLQKETILDVLDSCRIDPNRRGETLSLTEFCQIADTLFKKRNA